MRKMNWGVCTVTVSNSYFKAKMVEWVKTLPKELMNSSYYENIGGA